MSKCDCQEQAGQVAERSVLMTLLAINGVMFFAEIFAGVLAESTGLIADSLDMLADAAVYGIAFYAVGREMSTKIRAARFSGWFQIALAGGVLFDIVRRLVVGSDPDSWLMIGVGIFALIANVACLGILAKHRKGEIHMRASWIFSKNDVIANLGVILAALLIHFTGSRWPDLVIGGIITVIVFRGGIAILRDASNSTGLGSSEK